MHPPGPPLARPVLPRDRGTMDRVIEYFVGDGPQNRYALICQQCLTHNGMALKEEFEYVAFRCAYCYVLNPARKTRPQAPRLSEVTAEAKMPSHAPIPTSPTPVELGPVEPAPAPEADESPATAVAEKQPTPPAEEIQELATLTTDTAPETEVPGAKQSLQLTPVKSDGELDVSDMEVE